MGGSLGNTAQVGVPCYRSTDIYNWTNAGIALSVSEDPASEITKGCIIYFDPYIANNYGAIESTDLEYWKNITPQAEFPAGARHGTASEVPGRIIAGLLKVAKP